MIAGIDADTYSVTVAIIRDEPIEEVEAACVHRIVLRKASRSGEMAGLLALRELEPLLVASAVPWGELATVWIERGFGGSRRSDYALGAVAGALLAVIPCIAGTAEVNPIGLGEWRKAVTGNGNARTDDVTEALIARRVLPPATYGPGGMTHDKDEVDATGIAVAGRTINLLASGIA